MNLKGSYRDKLFTKPKEKSMELLSFISAIIAPSFVFIWMILDSKMPIQLRWTTWMIALLFTLLYCSIHISNFMRQHLNYFFYGMCYIATVYTIYVVHLNHFAEGYSLALMLVVFYIALTFEKIRTLLWYLVTTLVLVEWAVYIETRYTKVQDNNGLIVGICLVFFSVIALINLFIRNEDKRALKESEEDYQRLLDTSPNGVIVYEQGNIVYANESIAKLTKVKHRNELLGKSVFEFLKPRDYEQAAIDIDEILKGKHSTYKEGKINLDEISIDVELANIATTYKGKKAIMTIVKDISERKKIEEELVEAEAKYRSIVEGALVGVYIIQENKLMYINKYLEDTFGYCAEELYNMDFLKLISDKCKVLVMEGIQRLMSGSKDTMMEIEGVRKDGSTVYIQTHSKLIIYKGMPAIMGMLSDITEHKMAEKKITQMALYDSVTELPNRYFLNFQLKDSLENSKKNEKLVALMFIDLDRFKIINDTMGHNFGDIVLKRASSKIKKCLLEKDFMARYGGDEFIIVLEDASIDRAKQTAEHIVKRFSNALSVGEHSIDITPSIGISLYPMDGSDAETLVKYADTAMYHAKSLGRNNYKFYEPQMNQELSRRIRMENGLRKAIENGEFIVHYQPQIDFTSGDICGAEALIRWNHPECGIVPPNEFIPLAEETGLISSIGEWVLKAACMQNKTWQEAGLKPINIAINVSYQQLRHKGFVDSIRKVLKESGLAPQYLELEITESILKDIDELKAVLDEIGPMGIKLSIDDFGVGYSSLSMLQHLAVNNLKIDRSFIESVLENPKSAAIVKTIIDMGKNLDFNIIAEGIEHKEQVDFLKQNNCNIGQGYLFSRPLAAEYFEKLLREWKSI
jgi:diguanylate cyclase (GGDEF)-like protein/PAS domain S-box-containing protein